MEDSEIKDIAKSIYRNEIWTDSHCKSVDEIRLSFALLVLMDKKQCKLLEDAGMIYEYYDKAVPGRYANGMPIFFSFYIVNKSDSKKIWEEYDRIKSAVEG